jgi:16S rRNA (guanine966-N2)-methyltransferase
MKIIAGKYKGRKIDAPINKNVRPTKTIIKEAIFNILTHNYLKENDDSVLKNAIFADIFCGTGAVALEAISRGAKKVYVLDKDKSNIDHVMLNAKKYHEEDKIEAICCDINFIPSIALACDVIFLDPPYKKEFLKLSLEKLLQKGWVGITTIIIVELSRKENLMFPEELKILNERIYGNSKIILLNIK